MNVKVIVDLLDSSNNVIDTLYEDTVDSVMIGNVYDLPLDINTTGLAPGYYGIRATFLNPITGKVITTITREKALNVSGKVPDSSMIGIASLAAPDELGVGNTYKGQIVVPVKVPISYSIGRKVFLDKDGTQTTIVPEATTILNPNTPLSIDLNYDTSSLVEGKYDVILQLWDSEGDIFLQADIGDLNMQPEAIEIPDIPDDSMFGIPKLTAPDEVEIGQTWTGSISIPNKVLDAYPIGHRAYIRKGDVGAIISPSKITTVDPKDADLPLSINLDTAKADLSAGLYDVYLELWDKNGDIFLQAAIGDLILKAKPLPELPGSSMIGTPNIAASNTIDVGDIWSGEISIPFSVPKSYNVTREVYLEKDGDRTTVVPEQPVVLEGDDVLSIPFNIGTTELNPGDYGVYVQMLDNTGNSFFKMNIFTLKVDLPPLPTSTESLDFVNFLKENLPAFSAPEYLGISPSTKIKDTWPAIIDFNLPSISSIYGEEQEFRVAIIAELAPDWYLAENPSYVTGPPSLFRMGSTLFELGDSKGNYYTIQTIKTGQDNKLNIDYNIGRLTSKILLQNGTINDTDCNVWLTIKEAKPGDPITVKGNNREPWYNQIFTGPTIFQGLIGHIKLFNIDVSAGLGAPAVSIPSSLIIGQNIDGSVELPNPLPIKFTLSRELSLEQNGAITDYIIPKGDVNMTPGNPLDLSFSYDTSSLVEGKYDIRLKVWNDSQDLIFNSILGTINMLPDIFILQYNYRDQMESLLTRIGEAKDVSAITQIRADINNSAMPDFIKNLLIPLAVKKGQSISYANGYTSSFPEDVSKLFNGWTDQISISKPSLARTWNFDVGGIELFKNLVSLGKIPKPPEGISITDVSDSGKLIPGSKIEIKYRVETGGVRLPQSIDMLSDGFEALKTGTTLSLDNITSVLHLLT